MHYVHDAHGKITSDARSGTTYAYTYNARNRLASVAAGGITQATYVYDANEQLAIRDSIAAPVGVTHYVHDIFGNPGLRRGRLNRRNRRRRSDRRHRHRARIHPQLRASSVKDIV